MESPASTSVTVRPARPDEAHALAELAAATFPDASPPEIPREDILAFIDEHLSEDAFAGYLADPRYLVLVAETDDADPLGSSMLGYTLLDLVPEEEAPQQAVPADPAAVGPAYLSKVYLRDAARGTGASTRLLRATLEEARRRGHRHVWLGVNRANARANAFYEKAGFAVVGQRTFAVGQATGHDYVRLIDL